MLDLSGGRADARPWIAQYQQGVPPEIEPQALSLVDIWRRSRALYANKPAIESFGVRRSYEQLGEAADRVTAWLQSQGFAKGDRAAIMESLHGFNVRRWRENGLNLWAVSDINAEELAEFGEKFEAAMKQ